MSASPIKTLITTIAAIALALLCMLSPYLPGEYDSLAFTLSTIVQMAGVLGLLFLPTAILWMLLPRHAFAFACAAAVTGVFIAVILCLIAFFSIGWSLALILAAIMLAAVRKLLPRIWGINQQPPHHRYTVPCLLILVPAAMVLSQWILATQVTRSSRNRAITNSAELVGHIEAYREQYGHYPVTLIAQHKDYSPGVIGVEKYHYSPQGESYNLSFEQPRFIFDDLGAREWVVYNPRGEHRMYSHAAWHMLLTPEEQARGQGWFDAHDLESKNWKSFLFD